MNRVILTAAILCGLSQGAMAGPMPCGDRDKILSALARQAHEDSAAIGLAADGAVLEITASPAGTWTLLRTYPGQQTCILAVGTAWQAFPVIKGQPA